MRRTLRRHFASVGLASVVLVATVMHTLATRAAVRGGIPGVPPGREGIPSLILATVVSTDIPQMTLALAALVGALGLAERAMGATRTLAAWVTCAVTAPAAGWGITHLGLIAHRVGVGAAPDLALSTPITPVVGTVLASSAYCGPRWQRRIRVLGFAALLVLVLYSGEPAALYQLVAAIIGLVTGMLMARRRPFRYWARSSHHEARSILAVVVAVSAIGPFVALLTPRGYGLLRPVGLLFRDTLPQDPDPAHGVGCTGHTIACIRDLEFARLDGAGPVLLTLLPLLVLLVAAPGLWRGRRVAAWTAIVVQGFLAVLAAVYFGLFPSILDPDQITLVRAPGGSVLQTVLAVVIPAGVAVAVAVNLRNFRVHTDAATLRWAFGAVGVTIVVGAGLYVGTAFVPGQYEPAQHVVGILLGLPERYIPVGFLRLRRIDYIPVHQPARFISDWIGPAGWGAALIAVVACDLRAQRAASSGDQARVRELLRRGAVGSISWMATWSGSRYWYSGDGRHAVAYRTSSGVAVTLGEPIGPDDGLESAARAFVVACDDLGLTPVFYAVRPEFTRRLGPSRAWPTVPIGQDTVITPATFSMTGKRWQDVRSSINRADRAGVRAIWTTWEQSSYSVRNQIQSISEEWIAERDLPELEFTIGGIDELKDPEVNLMIAVGPDGQVDAATSWLPTFRDGMIVGWTLDFMRRRPDSMNGVMEFLIASTVLAARARDLDFVSLSVAPLSGLRDSGRDDALVRVLSRISAILEPAYGFASLATFKEKFQPTVRPLVMAYPEAIALPAISIALGRIYLPNLSVPDTARLLGALR